MAFLDLGSPLGVTAAGSGAESLARDLYSEDFKTSAFNAGAEAYATWVEQTREGVAGECGAQAVKFATQPDVERDDDFGQLRASHPGSGSI